ncbi:hypothetical protein VIGAN_03193100 [Vigna angularis var. angularis]|uniref:Uncharacterized protein n=1 Tax=Vigna angularis var. angularis TaxID=157739 RepID=A0A0S3RN95_PHAAN|nr:hypothetical protein VIGAN_03193100 [Vigna angularis var. angularis]
MGNKKLNLTEPLAGTSQVWAAGLSRPPPLGVVEAGRYTSILCSDQLLCASSVSNSGSATTKPLTVSNCTRSTPVNNLCFNREVLLASPCWTCTHKPIMKVVAAAFSPLYFSG